MTLPALKILLLGQNGQVSRELQRVLPAMAQLHIWGRHRLDLSQPAGIAARVRDLQPDLIINAAAYTAVEQAEDEQPLAMAINAQAPGVLAQVAAELDIPLIHYSTDYVFDGRKATPYREDDPTHPISAYAKSKNDGEIAIRQADGKHLILRTSWVYSLHGSNFLLSMQRLMQEREQLTVVDDQIGAPTWAGTVATVTRQMIEHWQQGEAGPWGTYHLTARGETSWFGFAEEIGRRLKADGKPCAQLLPIATRDYPSQVQRPLNSRLDCSHLQTQWQISLPQWRDALQQCLATPT